MGTKVHCKSYLPGYHHSMRDLNEDSSSSNWLSFYGDRPLANGQYCNGNGLLPRTNAYSGYEKYALKQTMLEHEAIFKHQVFELHRLYKIQRDMMDEIRRKELYKHRILETSSSSSRMVSEIPYEDGQKWQKPTYALSFTERNNTQTGRIPYQNGCSSSKDCEILECRPSKVRKKLFDLQLPADEYIDSEEEDNKISDISSYPPSTNHKKSSESSVKLNLGGCAKIDCNGDASKLNIGLADLNEPIQVEEMILPTSADFIGRATGRGEIKGMDMADKTKSQFLLGLPKEILQNSQHESNNGTSTNLHTENKGNGREWLSYTNEAVHSKTHLNTIPQGLQPDMSSQLKHSMSNKAEQPVGVLPFDHNRGDLWREKTIRGLEISENSRDLSRFNHFEPVIASNIPNPYPLLQSDLEHSWSHSISTWGKSNSSFTQKLSSIQAQPPLNPLGSLNKTSQSSGQGHEIFGDKWHLHGNYGSKPGFVSGLPNCNGFYPGSASVSKDVPTHFPSVGFDYLNCNKDDKVASERSISYSSISYLKGSKIFSKCSSNEVAPQKCLEIIDEERKCEDPLKVLPWLKAKPAFKNEGISTMRDSNSSEISFLQAASNHFSNKIGSERDEVGDCQVTRKILGFPIFDNKFTPKNESSSSLVSTSASLRCTQGEDVKREGKMRMIDINVACEPESGASIAAEVLIVEKERDKEVASFRTHIDLNSCVSEDEVTLVPSIESKSGNVKIAMEIDLEALPSPETEDEIPHCEEQQYETPLKPPQHKAELIEDEVAKIAAEALVAISSCARAEEMADSHPPEAPSADSSLLWFVDVVSSFEGNLDIKLGTNGGDNESSSCDEIDDFEAMTLSLTEVTEEEYMPKPFVPENQNLEETGPISLPNRTRRGHARRGRQRRDFQRDILPGLASLSRHEVTEDLQTFGGLMRATGYSWNSGLTRRNGGARGRRRLVVADPEPAVAVAVAASTICTTTPLIQQLNSIEVGLEDRGWGKTPRRPRRQRCPAGNIPPSIALT